MKKLLLIFFIINLSIAFSLSAQSNLTGIIKTIEGRNYLIYQVQDGETIFSICKKFEVGQTELIGANPNLISGLKQGETINIPFDGKTLSTKDVPKEKQKREEFTLHKVKKGETVYAISNAYNVTAEIIYKYNPDAVKGIRENDTLRIFTIGIKPISDGLQKEDADYYYHKVQPGENATALARKYNSSVDEINAQNPGVSENLLAGSVVKISKKTTKTKIETVDSAKPEFIQHEVEQGETFSSIKRKFGISKDDLIKLNPEVSDGLKVGDQLKLPLNKKTKALKEDVKAKEQGQHIVVKGQTLYNIAILYGVDVEALKKANPAVKDGKLKSGTIIQIPKVEVKPVEKPVVVVPEKQVATPVNSEEVSWSAKQKTIHNTISRKETFRISMFLPLFYDKNLSATNDSLTEEQINELDSLRLTDESIFEKYFKIEYNPLTSQYDTVFDKNKVSQSYERSLYHDSRNFLEFYEGALIAIDSLQKSGAKIELTLYDTEYSAKKVEALIQNPKLLSSNLIIGPVDVSLQKSISALSYKNQIPMISPFSPDNSLVGNNPFYFQVNPPKDYIIKKTADFVGDKFRGKNIIVLNHWGSDKVKEAKLAEQVREKFSSSGSHTTVRGVDYSVGGEAGTAQIRGVLKADIENIVIIPATDNRDEREAFLNRAINSLLVLSKEFNITLIGMNDYPRFKSISSEYFHQLNLYYLTPQIVDYKSSQMNSFLRKFRFQFAAEPTIYSCRGYDLVWYFVHAFDDFGRNYTEKISGFNADLLMSDFDFRRVKELSGFMNYSLFIVNLTPDFDVSIPYIYSGGKFVPQTN